MRKQHVAIKTIKNNWRKVFQCGYCDLQYIFQYETPQYYNAGVYGWNCDIYTDYARDIAITTGYRNMRGKQIPRELIEKHEAIAKEILTNTFKTTYQEIEEDLRQNKENFLDALNNL